MRLRICEIQLKNFKTFKELTIEPNPDFNIIIGENSIGKSTIFEALHLWEKCYKTSILAKKNGFYKVSSSTSRYVNYQDLDFLRITKDEDLFYNDRIKCAEITLKLSNDINDSCWSLGFKITSPVSIENAFFRVQPIEESEFASFAASFCATGKNLDEAIFIYQTRPVSGVHQYECYYNDAQIRKRIQKGSSHEVLRNKIIKKRNSIADLEASISEILEKQVKFTLPAANRNNKDEYIDLKVATENGKPRDLHLQGSGFLQIVEILSTLEFIDAPLKLLLVDEPDSHIHTKLQHKLINHLRQINGNQFFVISHNDQFVNNAGDNEVFFLNKEVKDNGQLNPIDIESFDTIKNFLGSVIISLEKLNRAKHIVFVEGNDDAEYLMKLNEKIDEITSDISSLSNVTFFPLRGKDNIVQKIEYNKRTLSSLLQDKTWNVIFDRDFSTDAVDSYLKSQIRNKNCVPFSHNGYCIESVLFSDIPILEKFICSKFNPSQHTNVKKIIHDVLDTICKNSLNIDNELNQKIELRFNGQKNNRPEFRNLQFSEVMRSWKPNGVFEIQRIMSKPLIAKFVKDFEQQLGSQLIHRSVDTDEELSSNLLIAYFDFLASMEDLYPSFKELLMQLDVLPQSTN